MASSLVASLLVAGLASSPGSSVLDREAVTAGWSHSSRAVDRGERLRIIIAVKQQNLAELKARALAISAPGNAAYGQHLNVSEIRALSGPSRDSLASVQSFLTFHHVPGAKSTYKIDDDGAVHLHTTVALAELIFNTTFVRVTHPDLGERIISRPEWNLPPIIAEAVDAVFGLRGLPVARRPVIQSTDALPKVTPAVLASTYSVGGVKVQRGHTHHQAVAEMVDNFMNKQDLSTFFEKLVADAQPGDDQVDKFVGAPYAPGFEPEAALDIQYIMGSAPGVATEFWSWNALDFCLDLYNISSQLLSSNVSVVSISYGMQGPLWLAQCKEAEVRAVDANLAKLAARGVSVLVSSGDAGAGYTRHLLFWYKLYPCLLYTSPSPRDS